MKHTQCLLSLTLLLLANISTQKARAETLDCTTIISLPTTITTQRIYCLTSNLSTSMISGNAIEIQANNVSIDLNGYKLGGPGVGNDTGADGIYAAFKKDITVKNGIVRGFRRGNHLSETIYLYFTYSGHVIKNILAD